MKLRILALAVATALVPASVALAKGKPNPTGANCRPAVSFILKGTFTSLGTDSFHMNVTHTNHHGRALLGDREVTFNASTRFRRQGHATSGDLQPGDRLKVQVRGCKADDPTTMVLLAKRVVAHPAPTN